MNLEKQTEAEPGAPTAADNDTAPPMRLYNTLSGQVETLAPSDGKALRMYACGPTVYDYGHIGNFRTFLQVDVLRRAMRLLGTEVRHVMNITDVDDKIIRNATAAGMDIDAYTLKYQEAFFEDLDALRVEHPEVVARATEHIPAMVSLIERLAAQDIAYRADDGSWYFRIARFPEYGKLSKKDFSGIADGARIDVDEYEKDSARDFALWKAPKPGEHHWVTALGPGRPGWHIECSAMAMQYLGDSFDLHAGGEDLMFRITKTRLPSRSPQPTGPLCVTGFTSGSCWSKAGRCRSRKATSIRCAICCCVGTRLRRSGCC